MTTTFTGPLKERQLIRERMGSYADSVFQQDVDAWLSHWTIDAVWRMEKREWRGHEALRAQWHRSWDVIERLFFFNEIGAIAISGHTAKARCYCHEIARYRNGQSADIVGLYEDTLIRTTNGWLFTERSYQLLNKK